MKTKTFEELTIKDKVYVCYEDGSYPGIGDIRSLKDNEIKFHYKELFEIKMTPKHIYRAHYFRQFDVCFSCENKFKEYIRSKRVERLNNMISKIEKQIKEVKEFREENWYLFSGDYYTKKIDELNLF